jgi:hypothetical protein
MEMKVLPLSSTRELTESVGSSLDTATSIWAEPDHRKAAEALAAWFAEANGKTLPALEPAAGRDAKGTPETKSRRGTGQMAAGVGETVTGARVGDGEW